MASDPPSLDTIFAAAIEIATPQHRDAYLDRVCAEDPALGQRVRRLVAAHFRAGDFLDGRAFAPLARPGTEVGPYRLLEQIGEGGMGTVFRAEQFVPVRREVALKVIKPGMDSRQVIARFEAERQALALMDHPNIARILDAGTTDEEASGLSPGRPYFVMELVRGKPITAFCDEHRLTVRQRLDLFVCVCQAVQHAHSRGVIHRDLKPSNVLVGSGDGGPAVKVIDFGIAKAVGQQLTEQTLLTGYVQLIGTPLYMSPEQADSAGPAVDPRSDVYSLGALLYELLTGTTPFESKTLLEAGYDEMRRLIREADPPRPSARLRDQGPAALAAAAARGVEPARLTALLRGELDWVVMKALEKDRGRRYPSAGAFAEDVQRHLEDEPVQARSPSVGYRLSKLLRKHRREAAVLAVGLLTVAVAAVSLGWVARQEASRRAAAEAGATQALHEVQRLERLSRWSEAQAVARHAQRLLPVGSEGAISEEVAGHLADLDLLLKVEQARLSHIEIDPRESRFLSERALAGYAAAFREWGQGPGLTTPQQAAARVASRPAPLGEAVLAALYDWHSLARRVEASEAGWLGEALDRAETDPWRKAMLRALGAGDRPALKRLAAEADVPRQPPELLAILGREWNAREAHDSAIDLLRRARLHYPNDFWINLELGDALVRAGDPARAVAYFTAAHSLRPSIAVAIELGSAQRKSGDLDGALATYRRMLAVEPGFAKGHCNLGNALQEQGQFAAAAAAYRESIGLNPRFWLAHHGLGVSLTRQGKLAEAAEAYRRGQKLAAAPPWAWETYFQLGEVLRQEGKRDEALDAYRQAAERARVTGDWELATLSDIAWFWGTGGAGFRDTAKAREVAGTLFKNAVHAEVELQHAGWLLYTGDRAGYRAVCARALARDGKTTDARVAYLVARMCALDTEVAGAIDRVEALARLAAEAHPAAWHDHTLGLAHYRARRFDWAAHHFRRAMAMGVWDAEVVNWLGLAVALHGAGKPGEGKACLEKARQQLARRPADLNSPMHPHDRIACRLLVREAEELYGGGKD